MPCRPVCPTSLLPAPHGGVQRHAGSACVLAWVWPARQKPTAEKHPFLYRFWTDFGCSINHLQKLALFPPPAGLPSGTIFNPKSDVGADGMAGSLDGQGLATMRPVVEKFRIAALGGSSGFRLRSQVSSIRSCFLFNQWLVLALPGTCLSSAIRRPAGGPFGRYRCHRLAGHAGCEQLRNFKFRSSLVTFGHLWSSRCPRCWMSGSGVTRVYHPENKNW